MNENQKSDKDQPWKTKDWFVSEWNYLDEVTEGFNPPKQVKVHDITLRDGEQQAGIIFTKDDKIRIAEKLSEVGVHRIEAGMPAVSPNDEAALRVRHDDPGELRRQLGRLGDHPDAGFGSAGAFHDAADVVIVDRRGLRERGRM